MWALPISVSSVRVKRSRSPKVNLVEALPSAADGGVAVLNADDRMVAAMASRTKARIVFVGQSEDCDVRATDVVVDDQARASFTLNCSQGSARIRLAVHGEHHVSNALAAAAVALENGLAVADIARVLEGTKAASARRMEVTERADGVTVVNEQLQRQSRFHARRPQSVGVHGAIGSALRSP